jgi:hypothetical protein
VTFPGANEGTLVRQGRRSGLFSLRQVSLVIEQVKERKGTLQRYLVIIFLCYAILAGYKTVPAYSGTFTQLSPQAPLVHQSSGFSFPAQIGSFQREEATQYDRAGEDISVGYNNYTVPIVATVYVYPTNARSLATEFAARQAEVSQYHPATQLLGTSDVTVTPKHIAALSASYSFEDIFAGTSQLLLSELLVAQSGKRFVEYRFTYPASARAAALSEIARFEREFVWP